MSVDLFHFIWFCVIQKKTRYESLKQARCLQIWSIKNTSKHGQRKIFRQMIACKPWYTWFSDDFYSSAKTCQISENKNGKSGRQSHIIKQKNVI